MKQLRGSCGCLDHGVEGLETWRCGLDRLHDEMGQEIWWINGEPGALQYVVWWFVDRGILMSCHGWLGKIKGFFGINEIWLINMASCDELQVGRLEP